ncbi:peroxiredoxin-6-like [Photinus pyralis]|uniref:Thioredoxin domain-containing protein n=1 Tax=Photinus pyralis TaxID=7054 RepID=A0A1Y1N744_PHOPY|nr:peroxiredoxin-6-like [Photinus pyralis]
MLKLGEIFPNIKAETTLGPVQFYDWMETSWCLLLSCNFNQVSASELVGLRNRLLERNVKVIVVSHNSLHSLNECISDIQSKTNHLIQYPIIADEKYSLALDLDLFESELYLEKDAFKTITAAFLIDPNKKLQFQMAYPPELALNFEEIIRVIDALQAVNGKCLATPAEWTAGGELLIVSKYLPHNKLKKQFPHMTEKVLPSGSIERHTYL